MQNMLNQTDILILCGGLGTRLRSEIGEKQKVMAEVGAEPFLDILLESLAGQGCQRIILCTGYKAQDVQEYYKNKNFGVQLLYSREDEPLGTGGAVRNARGLIQSNPFFVLNGDSFCKVSLVDFLDFHQRKQALASIVVSRVKDINRFGSIDLDQYNRIVEFKEKKEIAASGLVNAGVYLFDQAAFDLMPTKKSFSLEHEFFPRLTERRLFGFIISQPFIDIGTPQTLKQAKDLLKEGDE